MKALAIFTTALFVAALVSGRPIGDGGTDVKAKGESSPGEGGVDDGSGVANAETGKAAQTNQDAPTSDPDGEKKDGKVSTVTSPDGGDTSTKASSGPSSDGTVTSDSSQSSTAEKPGASTDAAAPVTTSNSATEPSKDAKQTTQAAKPSTSPEQTSTEAAQSSSSPEQATTEAEEPNTSTKQATTEAAEPNTSTKQATSKTSPSTPELTTNANEKPISAPSGKTARAFDGWSFFGGIMLTVSVLAISLMGYKYYKSRAGTPTNYNRF